MMKKEIFLKLKGSRLASGLAAFTAALAYLYQAWHYLFFLRSSLDEGNYLYKGYLFVTGVYDVYEPYGPWVNKMPLSFLIQGWVQDLFGPGLRTGRYFSFVLSGLLLLGLWLAARRISGRWWAAASLWALAVNPVGIKVYDQALSQVLVACVLVWVCALTLGRDRKTWEIMLGAALAGGLVLIRENMLPVPFFIVLYLFWQRGWRVGLLATAAGLLTFIAGHIVFWPDILRNWAKWSPAALTPFLDAWRVPKEGVRTYVQSPNWFVQLLAFFEGFRFNFLALAAPLTAWWLWPRRKRWSSRDDWRLSLVLSGLFLLLTAAHLWASVGGDYCVYCFSGYTSFFSPLGILLASVVFKNIDLSSKDEAKPTCFSKSQQQTQRCLLARILESLLAAGAAVLLLGGAIFQSYAWLITTRLYDSLEPWLYDLRLPRPGGAPVEIWRLFVNKFGLNADMARVEVLPYIGSALLGGLAVIIVLLLALSLGKRPYGQKIMLSLLIVGLILSPTPLLGGGRYSYDCSVDMIKAYEQVGADLAARIPTGSVLDWRGGGRASPALLLYTPGLQIFPPQLNGDYSFRLGGDQDELARFGYWNDELSQTWIQQADYLLIPASSSKTIEEQVWAAGYKELAPPPVLGYCPQKVELRLFAKP